MKVATRLHNASVRHAKKANADRISYDGSVMPTLPGTNSLQFRTQMNGGQTALKQGCVNTISNQILTADDQDLRLWTLRKEIKRAAVGTPVIGVVHVKSENFYIVGHKNSEVSLWWPSLRKFAQKKLILSTAKENMVAITFSQKRMELITSGENGALVIWILKNKDTLPPKKKRKSKKAQKKEPKPSGPYDNKWLLLPRCSFFNNSGIKLLSVDERHGFLLGASDTSVRLWDVKTAKMLKEYASVDIAGGNTAPITSLFYDETNKYCLVGYKNGQIMVWYLDVELVAAVAEGIAQPKDPVEDDKRMLAGHTRAVTAVSIVPTVPGSNANAFLTCGAEGRILQWDMEKFQYQGAFQFKFPTTSVDGVSINETLRPVPRKMMTMKVETHNFVKNVIVVMSGNSLVVLESRASAKPLMKLSGIVVCACVRDEVDKETPGGKTRRASRTAALTTVTPARIRDQHMVCMTSNEHVVVLDPDLDNNSMKMHDSFSCQSTALIQLPSPQFARTKTGPQFIHARKGKRGRSKRIRTTTITESRFTNVSKTLICKWDAALQLFVLGKSDGSVHLVNSHREVVTSFQSTNPNAVTALCTAVSPTPQRTSKPGVMMPAMNFVVFATAEGSLSAHPIAVMLPKPLRGPKTVPPPVSFVAHSSPVVSVMQMPLSRAGLGSGCIVSVEAAGAIKIWSPPPKLGSRGFFTASGKGAFVGAKVTAATLIENPMSASVSILLGFESGALWAWRLSASLELPKAAEASHPAAHRRRISALEWLSNGKLVDSQGLRGPRLFASASTDQSVKLWDADRFEQLRSFTTAEPVDTATFYLAPPVDGAFFRMVHILITSEKNIFSVHTEYKAALNASQQASLRAHPTPPPSRRPSASAVALEKQQLLSATAPGSLSGSPRGSPRSTYSATWSADMAMSKSASLLSESWDRKVTTLSPLDHTGSVPSTANSMWAAKSGYFSGVHKSQPLGRLVPVHSSAPANNLAGLHPEDLGALNTFHQRRRPATTKPNRRLSTRNRKLVRVTFDEYGRKVKHEVDLGTMYENSDKGKNINKLELKKAYQHVASRTKTHNGRKEKKKQRQTIEAMPLPSALRPLWLVPDEETQVTFSKINARLGGVSAHTETVMQKGTFPTLGNPDAPLTVAATVARVWDLYILRLQAQKLQAVRHNIRGKLKGSSLSRIMKHRYLKQHEETFAYFVYQTYQRRAGVQILAQERLLRLLDSLLLHKAHPACKLCGRFLTLFGTTSHLKEETFRIFGEIMLPLFDENKLWSPQTQSLVADLVTVQSKPRPMLQTMYLYEEDFINQASACLADFVDPVFLHNVFSIVHNLPTPEFDGMVNAHRAFLDFLDLWDKRDKVERGGAEVLFKLSRNVITEAQTEEQRRRRYLGLQGLHDLLKQFLIMDRERLGAIKRADLADLLAHSSLMATCTQRALNAILHKFSTVDFNTVPVEDEDLVLIPYEHLWVTLRCLLAQPVPELVSPNPTEIKLGLECILVEAVQAGSFRLEVNDHSEIKEYYEDFAGRDYEQMPLPRRPPLSCTINPRGANEERVGVVGFGSVLLQHELQKSHLVGEVVRVLPTEEWLAEHRPPPPELPKQLPLLAHLAHLASLEMLPDKGAVDYQRFDKALQMFQSAVYLGHGKPDPLPPFSSKPPVKILEAKVKLDPETKTEGKKDLVAVPEGGAAEAVSDAPISTEVTSNTTPSKDDEKKQIPLWDRLSKTPLQCKRSAQVAREQKVDAGPAGGSLLLINTLGTQPQSDLYMDLSKTTHKMTNETRGAAPYNYHGPLDGVLQFSAPPTRARLDEKPSSHMTVASRFRKDPLYLKSKNLNPLAAMSWPKELRGSFTNTYLGIQIIPPHVFLYFSNMAKQRKLWRALEDVFFGAIKKDRNRQLMQIPLSFLPMLLSFLEHVGVVMPAYIYDMARKVRTVLVQQSRGSMAPSNADAVLATMFDGVDVDDYKEVGSEGGVLRRKLLTPAQQKELRDSRYRHALALLARDINWGPPYKSLHVNEDDLDAGGDGTRQKTKYEAMDPREKHKIEMAAKAKRELEAKLAAEAEAKRLAELRRLEAIALAERQRQEELERQRLEREASLVREAAEREEMAKADAESKQENDLHNVGYFDMDPETIDRLNLTGNPEEDRVIINELAEKNGMAPSQWMSLSLNADRERMEMEAKKRRLAKAHKFALKFLKKKGRSTVRKARSTKWLQKRGKHACRQALAEKRLRMMGRQRVKVLAHRAQEVKLMKYRARKFLAKIGSHSVKRHKAEAFLQGLGKTHVKSLASEAKRAKLAAALKEARDEALEYLNRLSRVGLERCRARKYLRNIGQHWVKTHRTQAAAKVALKKMGATAKARAKAEAFCREEGKKAIEYIKVMIMLEKQKPPPPKPKKKKPPPLTPRKEKKKNKLQRLRDKIGSAMRFSKVGKDHRIDAVERMKTQILMMAKIKRFRNRISDAEVLKNNPLHEAETLNGTVAIKALNFNENIQVRSLLSTQNDTYLPQWTPDENADASDEDFDALLEEDLEDATTMQRRKHRTSPLLLETNVTIGADDKDFQWKEFFDGQAHGIHDKMKDMFDRSEEISDRPAVAADYARLCKHRDEQEAIEREKKRKEAKRLKRRKAKEERERRLRMQRHGYVDRNKREDQNIWKESAKAVITSSPKSDAILKTQRVDRKRRAEALKSGEIHVTPLSFDEWKTAVCPLGDITYFEVLLPEGRPLIVNVDVKRGACKLFMSARELPSETDSTWGANQYTMETHARISLYPEDPSYQSDVLFYIGVCCGSAMNSRFRIQASCLQLPAAEITTSVAMKNAAANMEKISTVYERLRREHVDDPQEDDELDAIEAELAAGLVSAGVVTLSRQRVKKTTEYEDDDTSEESEDGFSDVSSVGDLPKDLQDRMMEFNS